MDAAIAAFNAANPDVNVIGTYQGSYPDISKKITAAIAGNGLPDVAVSYQNDIANYVLSGAKIQPLDAWITDTQMGFSSTDLADIYPSYIDHYPGSNNQVLSIAYNRSMEVMYYNADMLQAAGFGQPPASWDDFMADCAKIAQVTPGQRATPSQPMPRASPTGCGAAAGNCCQRTARPWPSKTPAWPRSSS